MIKLLNKCGRIERLLYLYRDGELSPREKSMIDDHTRTCTACASLLKNLQILDSHLKINRSALAKDTNREKVINAALRQITGHVVPGTKYKVRSAFLPSWIRPVLAGSLILILSFLSFQQLRDALRTSALEHRLRERTPSYTGQKTDNDRQTGLLLNKWQGKERQGGILSPVQRGTAPGNEIYEKVLTLWRRIFEQKNGFPEHVRDKYPGLSAVDIDDGLSMQERIILMTEGKALIKELEQLTKYGE
jgi:hypothetical protein